MSVVISAAQVKELRDITGAGMADCKNALVEANGNFEEAIDLLRKRGQKLSAKRADRETSEGCVFALTSENNTRGIVVDIRCETDFVAKNEDFVAFAKEIADVVLANFPANYDALAALTLSNGMTIADALVDRTAVIGEKIEVKNYERLEATMVVPYIHMGYRAGVIVALNENNEAAFEAGKNVAMQVAAMKPVALDKDGVNAETVEREIEIAKELARNEGKPEEMLEKIAVGRLNKFYQESTLLNQEYVKGNKQSVRDYLSSVSKGLTATAFFHVSLK